MPKAIRLNSRHSFIMKIPNKNELQEIDPTHLSDTDFKDLMKLNNKYTKEPYSLLVGDTFLSSDTTLRFRKNIW